jgi:hypothetical protein
MDVCAFCGEYVSDCTCEDISYSIHAPQLRTSTASRERYEEEQRKLEEFEILKRHHYGQVDHERKHS